MTTDNNHIDENMLLDDERIANYLKGKMTAEEEQAFLADLQADPELKAQAVAMARMVKGMKEVGTANDEELKGEFLAADADEVGVVAKDAVSTNKRIGLPIAANRSVAASKPNGFLRPWSWLMAAASVTLLIWAGIGYNDYRTTTGLGNQYATVFTSSQLTRSGEAPTQVETKLTKLFDNVVNGKDIEATVHDLSLCWELSTQETYNDYTDYELKIGWNLAICHLKNNDRKQAKAVLEKLTTIAPAGTTIGEQARELLKRVDEI